MILFRAMQMLGVAALLTMLATPFLVVAATRRAEETPDYATNDAWRAVRGRVRRTGR